MAKEVRVTLGHCLPARYVVHAVWEDEENQGEEEKSEKDMLSDSEMKSLSSCLATALFQVMKFGYDFFFFGLSKENDC